jgi:ABC-type nitrate/sulfonate/bicarbonate transport system ATPase subunit
MFRSPPKPHGAPATPLTVVASNASASGPQHGRATLVAERGETVRIAPRPSAAPAVRLDLRIEHKAYRNVAGGRHHVLSDIAFAVEQGEIAAIVGPSGCGKTTLLRIVVGLDRDFIGRVRLPGSGPIGMVFQEPRLLPWRTIEQNVRLAAPAAGEAALGQLFGALGLAAHRRHYPGELSVGLARRAALARAFAVEPELLVLDEPFVSVDVDTAMKLRAELAQLVGRRPVTTLLVTHDIEEAIGLADRIVVLSLPPTRVLSDLRIDKPRAARRPGDLTRLCEQIRTHLTQA